MLEVVVSGLVRLGDRHRRRVYAATAVVGGSALAGVLSTVVEGAVFVTAAFLASASWQLALAAGGASLGQVVTGPRGRLVTGLLSALVIAALAVRTVLS